MRKNHLRALLCSLCMAAPACGSSSSDNEENVSSTGDFREEGASFAARGGVASVLTQSSADGDHAILRVWLMDTTNVCTGGLQRKDSKTLQMDVVFPANANAQPGNYAVGDGNSALPSASISRFDSDSACLRSSGSGARAGRVSFAIVNDTLVEGTFSAEFDDASISGTFQIPNCPKADSDHSCQ